MKSENIKPRTTIVGDKRITSWEDEIGFTMFIQPRMPTSQEINDALMEAARKDPNIVIGQWRGLALKK